LFISQKVFGTGIFGACYQITFKNSFLQSTAKGRLALQLKCFGVYG
jgi:hypothetical protein